jgi:hypothetical protein
LKIGGTHGLQNPAKLDSSPYDPLPSFDYFNSLPFCLVSRWIVLIEKFVVFIFLEKLRLRTAVSTGTPE